MALPLASVNASAQEVPSSKAAFVGETGTASYYGNRHQGRPTASGARFDQRMLTAAHAWLPFGTKVRVTALNTGKSVIETTGDRSVHCRGAVARDDAGRPNRGQFDAGLIPRAAAWQTQTHRRLIWHDAATMAGASDAARLARTGAEHRL
jgi:rare lipoprotein A